MQSTHEIHVDLVRLLSATERIVAAGEPSADGSWEHWPRFCQFITSLDSTQSQLQARVAEVYRGAGASLPPAPPAAEDLADYDRRLEILRRKRDDLASAAAAAAAAAAASAKNSAATDPSDQQQQQQQQQATVTGGVVGGTVFDPQEDGDRVVRRREARGSSRRRNAKDSSQDDSGGVFGGRRRGGRGEGGGGRAADEAEADQVAQEISSMAGRLKESSVAINQTLRTQTQVLEDTGDAATQNVDRVKRENARVSERLRKKRAAMFASWCMMITVVATFFATYFLVIMPFEKRRGPFVTARTSAFAQAAEPRERIPSQHEDAATAAGAATAEEIQRRAQEAYRETARRARGRHEGDNAAHRVAREEKEAFRHRQAERMMVANRDRKAAMKKNSQQKTLEAGTDSVPQHRQEEGAEEGQVDTQAGSCSAPPPASDESSNGGAGAFGSCTTPPPDEDGDATASAGSFTAPSSDEHADDADAAAAAGSCTAPPPDEDSAEATGGCTAPPPGEHAAAAAADTSDQTVPAVEGAEASATQPVLDPVEEHRRRANQAYEERSRRETENQESTNAGLRLVAEEKERYRQQQAEKILQAASERKAMAAAGKGREKAQARQRDEEEEVEAALQARALGATGGKTARDDNTATDDTTMDDDNDERSGGGQVDRAEGPAAEVAEEAGKGDDDAAALPASSVDSQEVGRRRAEEARLAYEQNARRAADSSASQNAGQRLVSEEKEKYRQRQAKKIMEGAARRKQQRHQQGGETSDQLELAGDGSPPDSETGRENADGKVGNPAEEPSSGAGGDGGGGGGAPPAVGSSGRGSGQGSGGLDAVRMRLRESLGSKRGGRGGGETSTNGHGSRRDEL